MKLFKDKYEILVQNLTIIDSRMVLVNPKYIPRETIEGDPLMISEQRFPIDKIDDPIKTVI